MTIDGWIPVLISFPLSESLLKWLLSAFEGIIQWILGLWGRWIITQVYSRSCFWGRGREKYSVEWSALHKGFISFPDSYLLSLSSFFWALLFKLKWDLVRKLEHKNEEGKVLRVLPSGRWVPRNQGRERRDVERSSLKLFWAQRRLQAVE